MTRKMILITLVACLLTTIAVYAGRGMSMKCQAKPEKNPTTGKTAKPCGYEAMVTIGGGMFSEQMTGYCRACKKFVHLHWTAKNLPPQMKTRIKVKPHPIPLGEVWDARTGKILTIHACPKCKGPFLEIKEFDELKHCPACNKPHFAVDKNKPRLAID
ncbi:MAG: hypothetical protein QGG42_19630 [Phycisphaerae bacterium]|nr:hypothetical protein [Phycisphaerae bacterium]